MKKTTKRLVSSILAASMLFTSVLTSNVFAGTETVSDETAVVSDITESAAAISVDETVKSDATVSAYDAEEPAFQMKEGVMYIHPVIEGQENTNDEVIPEDKIGQTVNIDFYLHQNPGFSSATFFVKYDPNVLKAKNGNIPKKSGLVSGNYITYSYYLEAIDSDVSTAFFTNSEINDQIAYVPDSKENMPEGEYVDADPDGVKTAGELGKVKLAGMVPKEYKDDNGHLKAVSGDGKLFSMTFDVIGKGDANLSIEIVKFGYPPMSADSTDGQAEGAPIPADNYPNSIRVGADETTTESTTESTSESTTEATTKETTTETTTEATTKATTTESTTEATTTEATTKATTTEATTKATTEATTKEATTKEATTKEATTEATTQATTKAATTEAASQSTTKAATTDATTETTTTARRSGGGSSSSAASGGGGGSVRKSTTTTTVAEDETEQTTADVEDTTVEDVTEPDTEATTEETPAGTLFNDISGKPWAEEAINALAELGIINGVAEGTFAPEANCKRADFAIMLAKVCGLEGTATSNFDDVEVGKYYYNYVGLAKEAGIVKGYGDGNFGPEKFCTRAELMVMVANALSVTGIDITADESVLAQFSDEADIPAWARPYVAFLVENGIVSGSNGEIRPNVNITRAEVAVIMYNILTADIRVSEETAEAIEETLDADEQVEVPAYEDAAYEDAEYTMPLNTKTAEEVAEAEAEKAADAE